MMMLRKGTLVWGLIGTLLAPAATAAVVEPGTSFASWVRSAAISGSAPSGGGDFRERVGAGSSAGSGFVRLGAASSPELAEAGYGYTADRFYPVEDFVSLTATSNIRGFIRDGSDRDIATTSQMLNTFGFTVLEPVQYDLSGSVSVVISELVGSCAPIVYSRAKLTKSGIGGLTLVDERLSLPVDSNIPFAEVGVLLPGTYFIELLTYAHASAESGGAAFDFDVFSSLSMRFAPVPAPGSMVCISMSVLAATRRRRV